MTEDVGVLWAVVLGQIHVEIGRSLGLLRIEAQGPRSPRRGRVHKNLLRCVVHRVTNDKSSSLRRARTVIGVCIDVMRRLLNRPAHEIDVGDGMSELDCDELGRMRADTTQHVLDEATGAAVPASGDSGPPEPEPGALEVKVGGADCTTRRHGRPSDIKGVAHRIRHADRGPRPGMDPHDVLGH
jgi:hypothetical protein